MPRMMSPSKLCGVSMVLAALAVVVFVVAPPAAAWVEPQPPGVAPRLINEFGDSAVAVPLCDEDTDLDCVDAVTIVRGTTRISPTLAGNLGFGTNRWAYQGPTGEQVNVLVRVTLTPVGVIQSWGGQVPGILVSIDREPAPGQTGPGIDQVDCTTGRPSDCIVNGPALPASDAVEVRLRMSWLKPLNVASSGNGLFFRQRKLTNGSDFTLRARESLLPVIEGQESTPPGAWRSVAWRPDLRFVIDHAGRDASESAYDPRCANFGAPATASNAQAAGQPYWDSSSRSLNFGILGVHRAPDGSLYRGVFEAMFPIAWLRCQSGESGLRLNGFVVQVLAEDGVEQAATTSLRQRNGIVTVRALNFHYSSPTVRIVEDPLRRP